MSDEGWSVVARTYRQTYYELIASGTKPQMETIARRLRGEYRYTQQGVYSNRKGAVRVVRSSRVPLGRIRESDLRRE